MHDVLGIFSQEHGERVLAGVHFGVHGRYLRQQRVEFARGEFHIEFIGDSALIADVHDAQRFAQHGAGAAQDAGTDLQAAQVNVGAHHVGNQRGEHAGARRCGGLHVIARGLELAPVLAEDVEFPHRIETRNGIDVLQAVGVVRRYQALFSAAAREVGSRASPAAALPSTSGKAWPATTAS